jgi:hypothetical protein
VIRFSILIVYFFVFSVAIVSAQTCQTGANGWIVCQNSDGSQRRATSCDQLSGIGTETCGAGSGCGLTGCYNCADQGNCGGGGGGISCGGGTVYDPCATGGDCPRANQTKTVCDQTCYPKNNSCPSCSDAGVWSDCVGGNAPTWSCWQEVVDVACHEEPAAAARFSLPHPVPPHIRAPLSPPIFAQ